jgi:heme/copper-type cytochrome/quinol oxidase subunit 3
MTTTDASAAFARPESLASGKPTGWWGMIALIATEATLFVMLVFSYFYLRWQSPRWPPDGIALPTFTYIIPATILLLGSSIPVVWAEWGIHRGDQRALRLGFLIAWLMAACFMALELYEWAHLGYGPQRDVYASLFFTITGLHLLHLSVALVMSIYIQIRAWLGQFDAEHSLAVENVSLYWHFVDAVWVVVFSTLYISPFIK